MKPEIAILSGRIVTRIVTVNALQQQTPPSDAGGVYLNVPQQMQQPIRGFNVAGSSSGPQATAATGTSNSTGPSLFGGPGGTPAAGGAAPITFTALDYESSASAQAPGVYFASFRSQPSGSGSSAAASSSNHSTSTGHVGSVSFGGFSQPNASTSSSTSAPGSGAGPSSSGAVMFGGTATGTPPSVALFGGSGAGTSSTGAPSSGFNVAGSSSGHQATAATGTSNSTGPSLFGGLGGTPAEGVAAPFTFAAPDCGSSASAQAPGISFDRIAFRSQPSGSRSSAATSSSNPSTSTGPVGSVSFGGFSQPNASTSSSMSAPGAGPSSSGAVMFGGTATGTPPSTGLFGGSGAGTSSTGAPSSVTRPIIRRAPFASEDNGLHTGNTNIPSALQRTKPLRESGIRPAPRRMQPTGNPKKLCVRCGDWVSHRLFIAHINVTCPKLPRRQVQNPTIHRILPSTESNFGGLVPFYQDPFCEINHPPLQRGYRNLRSAVDNGNNSVDIVKQLLKYEVFDPYIVDQTTNARGGAIAAGSNGSTGMCSAPQQSPPPPNMDEWIVFLQRKEC